jgi:hypothetical protein
MYIAARRGHADPRLRRRDHDAHPAGGRDRRQPQGYLEPEHYNQIFSAHGTIMIFFAAMPLVIGFMNFVTPLQLGVRDVAFPTMNSVSFWLTASGACWSTSPCSSASSPAPAGSPTRRSARPAIRPASASIIISGRSRSPGSAR